MGITPEHIDQLIVRFLANEASQEEIVALIDWRTLSEDNEKYFAEMQFIYETSTQIRNTTPVDTQKAWQKVKAQIQDQETKVVPIYPVQQREGFGWSKWAIAASLLLMVTLGGLWVTMDQKTEIASDSNSKQSTLDDGTTVALAAHSSLRQIAKGKREYKLEGEASFTVVHDAQNPFVIHTDEALIKDIGTVFKVSYLPKNDTVMVRVTEGIVQFYTQADEGIMLQEGESGYYLRSSKKFYKYGHLSDANAVRRMEEFDNVTLREVAARLSRDFQREIVFENETLKSCTYNGNFKDQTLEEILDIITETLGIWKKEKDGKIVIGGKAC